MGASPLVRALRSPDELRLVPYVMAGFPDRAACVETARRYAEGGAAAIEVGVPFSDPLADGPAVQAASQAALEAGVDMAACLEVAAAIVAGAEAPVVLMTYINPVLAFGAARFAREAAAAGVSGVIIPDVPAEEASAFVGPIRAAGLDTVFLVAPTSSDQRIRAAAAASTGFVYCVTLTGITGARQDLPSGLPELLARVRAQTDLPVAAGFGLSRPEHMSLLRGVTDAAVVASALLRETHAGRDPLPLFRELIAACR